MHFKKCATITAITLQITLLANGEYVKAAAIFVGWVIVAVAGAYFKP